MRIASLLVKFGILVPVIYYAVLIGGGYMTPGYDHMTMYASELGMAGKPAAQIFNYGIIAAGVCAILGGIGILFGMRALGSGIVWAVLASLAVIAWGVSFVFGGLHPMPDPLHNGYMLGLAVILAPLFMFLGLAGRSEMGGLKAVLIISFLAMVALNVIMFNIGELNLVKSSNVGLWQRGYGLAMIPWIGIACLCIDQALGRRSKRSRDPMRDVVFGEGAP